MKKILATILSTSIWASIVAADDIDPLIGDWISSDGFSRQSVKRAFDDDFIETRMWFQGESGWQAVAVGFGYRRPADREWIIVSKTKEMGGIELFESMLSPVTETSFLVTNISYMADGSAIRTEEDWKFDGPDCFGYTVYKIEDGNRVEWLSGEWVRYEAGQ